MPYDLYGKYYPSRKEAMRMERYQMREIDADIAEREAQQKDRHIDFLNSQIQHYEGIILKEREMKDELTAGILPKD